MHCLPTFDLSSMIQCGRHLRGIGDRAQSVEDASQQIVDFLHDNLALAPDQQTTRASVLTRLFITRLYSELNEDQKNSVRFLLQADFPREDFNCLTLIASRGDEPQWNSPKNSENHKAIPLLNAEQVNKLPMVASLLKQLGVEVHDFIKTRKEIMLDPDRRQNYGIFLVPQALGSPAIPDQEHFVKPYGIQSVFGFGGRLMPGYLFSVILFTRCQITREKAELFRTLALNARVSLLRHFQFKPIPK